MDKLRFLIFLFCWLPLLSFAVPLNDCSKDSDCGKDQYCLHSYCTSCIPCEELMNRQSPPSSSGESLCAREESDCNNCLPGYQEEERVNEPRSIKCYPLPEGLALNQPDDGNVKTINYFMSVAIVGFIVAVGLAFLNPKFRLLLTPSSYRYVQMKDQNILDSPNFQNTGDQDELHFLGKKPLAVEAHQFRDVSDSQTILEKE